MGELVEADDCCGLTYEQARRLRRLIWHGCLVLLHLLTLVALCAAADEITTGGLHAALLAAAAFVYAMTLRTAMQGVDEYREGE
jgi:hypothetical protein